MQLYGTGSQYGFLTGEWAAWDLRKDNNAELTLRVSGTDRTAIHSGSIGSQSVNYASTAGSAPNGSNLNVSYGVNAQAQAGLKFWNGSDTYKIHMGNSAEYHYGPVTDYSIKTNMDSVNSTRGFTWGQSGYVPIAALNVGNGNFQIAGTFCLAGSDSHIKGGTITSRQGSRFIDVGYSGSCYIEANRTDSASSTVLIGAAYNGTGIWSRVGTTNGGATHSSSPRQFTITVGTSVAVTVATNRYVTLHGGGNTSDIILKKNIEDHGYGLDAVNNLKPRKFNWREHTLPQEKQVGFIAQELQEVIPEAVYGYDGAKAIMPSAMISVLTKAIQELSQQVTDLKAEVELLKQ